MWGCTIGLVPCGLPDHHGVREASSGQNVGEHVVEDAVWQRMLAALETVPHMQLHDLDGLRRFVTACFVVMRSNLTWAELGGVVPSAEATKKHFPLQSAALRWLGQVGRVRPADGVFAARGGPRRAVCGQHQHQVPPDRDRRPRRRGTTLHSRDRDGALHIRRCRVSQPFIERLTAGRKSTLNTVTEPGKGKKDRHNRQPRPSSIFTH